ALAFSAVALPLATVSVSAPSALAFLAVALPLAAVLPGLPSGLVTVLSAVVLRGAVLRAMAGADFFFVACWASGLDSWPTFGPGSRPAIFLARAAVAVALAGAAGRGERAAFSPWLSARA